MHYLDEGNPTGEVVLLLHGEPTWSYLYRKMVPILAAAGFRVIAPDLVGFGKSDKILEQDAYSYQSHVDWLSEFIETLDLQNITLFCQDWGGLIGLRVAAENPQHFARIVAANTGLPTGDQLPNEAFLQWKQFSQTVPVFPTGSIVSGGCVQKISPACVEAYNAPFPDETYKTAARMFPTLVPATPNDPASAANRRAWVALQKWEKPFLTLFSDSDPITAGTDRIFQKLIPGCVNQAHQIIEKAGHFLQEDKGEELVHLITKFIQNNPK